MTEFKIDKLMSELKQEINEIQTTCAMYYIDNSGYQDKIAHLTAENVDLKEKLNKAYKQINDLSIKLSSTEISTSILVGLMGRSPQEDGRRLINGKFI